MAVCRWVRWAAPLEARLASLDPLLAAFLHSSTGDRWARRGQEGQEPDSKALTLKMHLLPLVHSCLVYFALDSVYKFS